MGKKLADFGIMPLNDRGIPEITPGRHGPEGTWNKNNRTGNTFIKNLGEDPQFSAGEYRNGYQSILESL
ncbi:hypothetical protein VV11_015140 [Trichodesmium erythraeum 21-75]|nr:hypothetical protein [Trichodesmium erythraeum 21-75]